MVVVAFEFFSWEFSCRTFAESCRALFLPTYDQRLADDDFRGRTGHAEECVDFVGDGEDASELFSF
jgi:hypothetical protein